MTRLVAVGGGSVGFGAAKPEVDAINREMLRLTGKKRPRVLFLPTASGDDPAYIRVVEAHFRRLGGRVETLPLWKAPPPRSVIEKRILSADLLYVGGGNTLRMLGLWKRLGVAAALRKAWRRGKVLGGTSAGAICWFALGSSDSRKYRNPKARLIRVTGLGFLDALACPHYDVEKDRKPELKRMTRGLPKMAIALDNCAALEVVGDRARLLTSKPGARGYRVFWKGGRYFEVPLGTDWVSWQSLLKKA